MILSSDAGGGGLGSGSSSSGGGRGAGSLALHWRRCVKHVVVMQMHVAAMLLLSLLLQIADNDERRGWRWSGAATRPSRVRRGGAQAARCATAAATGREEVGCRRRCRGTDFR